jgi:hypothetical protein
LEETDVLTYSVDGSILTVVAAGTTGDTDRQHFYQTIREDSRVPDGALLLVDATRADPAKSIHELRERAHLIALRLGRKMGPVCAVITPPRLTEDAVYFQAASGELGVRVGIFTDEAEARRWLADFARQA